MPSKLADRIQQTQGFESAAHEALLSLLVASAAVREEIEQACSQHGLSAPHYNVLRILAGAPEEGHARGDLSARMMDRRPDVTRLIDRLEQQGLAQRSRCPEDRRRVMHRITGKGRALLRALHADVQAVQQRLARHLSEDELRQLSSLCEALYDE